MFYFAIVLYINQQLYEVLGSFHGSVKNELQIISRK